ncbi:UNVERIFIED_CONTAM: hypothetical protein PYX00_011791 [Menopon gallinae]|uniref:Uncharacterized protein n=1 Tax=Menopon gallinae TaxID=328185 RepID=A0AAW2H8Q1_9NEOP
MNEELAKIRGEFEMRLLTIKRGLLNELRNEYEAAIKKTPQSILRMPVIAFKSLCLGSQGAADSERAEPSKTAASDASMHGNKDAAAPPRVQTQRVTGGRKIIREASIVGQSIILEDLDASAVKKQSTLLQKAPSRRPPFSISVGESSILIDKMEFTSNDPNVVGNIIKDIQKVLKKHCRPPLNFKYVQSFGRSIKISDLISAVESDLYSVTGRNVKIVQITTRDHYALLGHSEIVDVLVDEDVLMVYVAESDVHADDQQAKCVSLVKKPAKKTAEFRKDTSVGSVSKKTKTADLQEELAKKGAGERQGPSVDVSKGKEARECGEQRPKKEAAKERMKADSLSRSKEEQKSGEKESVAQEEGQNAKPEMESAKQEAVQESRKTRSSEEKVRETKEKPKKETHSTTEGGTTRGDVSEERRVPERPEKKRKSVGGDGEGEKMIPLKKKAVPRDEEGDSIFK